jgi:hypothetical protein
MVNLSSGTFAPAELTVPDRGRDRLRRSLTQAERQLVAHVVADGGIARWRDEACRQLWIARCSFDRSSRLARSQAARLVVALADRPVRDSVRDALESSQDRAWPAFWLYVSRRALPPYRAEPLFLLAWSAWRLQQSGLARTATARAMAEDPTHRGAALLAALLGRDPAQELRCWTMRP